jgi:hypothetical protein
MTAIEQQLAESIAYVNLRRSAQPANDTAPPRPPQPGDARPRFLYRLPNGVLIRVFEFDEPLLSFQLADGSIVMAKRVRSR